MGRIHLTLIIQTHQATTLDILAQPMVAHPRDQIRATTLIRRTRPVARIRQRRDQARIQIRVTVRMIPILALPLLHRRDPAPIHTILTRPR